jgi:ribose 5-phosphate isomerase B
MPGLGRSRASHRIDPKLLTELAPELNVVHAGNVAGMRVAVAFDHRGVKLRERVLEELTALGHEAVDLGTDDAAVRVDYPDKAREIGEAIRAGDADRGVLVCGSGVGASVAANKLDGIRAAVCHDVYSAHQGVEHDDMNVLCLGSEVVGAELAADLVRTFLAATFGGGDRYLKRLRMVEDLERKSYA